jgi:ABC-type sugar transport system permease subunit
VVVLAPFVTPILFMLTGSLRKAGLPPPRGLDFLPAPLAFDNYARAFNLVAITFVLAFYEYDLIRPAEFRALGNFRELLDDDVFKFSLRNSLVFVLAAVPLRLLGAFGLALLFHTRFRGVGTYRTGAYLPTVVPDVAFALLWLWILTPSTGR